MPHVATALGEERRVAQLPPCLLARLVTGDARVDQLLDPRVEVNAQLVSQISIDVTPAAQPFEQAHDSTIASTSRTPSNICPSRSHSADRCSRPFGVAS
jgi:hypothetical protein